MMCCREHCKNTFLECRKIVAMPLPAAGFLLLQRGDSVSKSPYCSLVEQAHKGGRRAWFPDGGTGREGLENALRTRGQVWDATVAAAGAGAVAAPEAATPGAAEGAATHTAMMAGALIAARTDP
jgi:hypothetical protein